MNHNKYGRTYHFPFSPGTTSDDRISWQYWDDVSALKRIIHTEKLDGENNCLSRYGVFARSHAAPTVSPWTRVLRERWNLMRHDLGDLEIFGENLYAVHSIEYRKLEDFYYVFAVRQRDTWLCWDEVCFYAALFDFPVVPVLQEIVPTTESAFRESILAHVRESSVFESYDAGTDQACTREGVVSRDAGSFSVDAMSQHVWKYVRQGHVKTDEHWTRHWRRARMYWEYPTSK